VSSPEGLVTRPRYLPWLRRCIREAPLTSELSLTRKEVPPGPSYGLPLRALPRRRQRLVEGGVDGDQRRETRDLDDALRVTRPADHAERGVFPFEPLGVGNEDSQRGRVDEVNRQKVDDDVAGSAVDVTPEHLVEGRRREQVDLAVGCDDGNCI
jgi:hypothetical protein